MRRWTGTYCTLNPKSKLTTLLENENLYHRTYLQKVCLRGGPVAKINMKIASKLTKMIGARSGNGLILRKECWWRRAELTLEIPENR